MKEKSEVSELAAHDGWFPQWLSWRPTSSMLLYAAEAKILNRLKSQIESFYVPVLNNTCRLRTIIARSYASLTNPTYKARVPIVLVHGMGAGVAFWCKNLDQLAEHRPVYAMDMLGFGRSSRPPFPSNPKETEDQFIRSLEEWRSEVDLDRFILVGHSLGGYLSYAYAIRHPERVSHLVLVDPWGFPERAAKQQSIRRSYLMRSVAYFLSHFNPLGILRVAGPFGPMLVRKFRQDLGVTFNSEDDRDVADEDATKMTSPPPDTPGWLIGQAVMGNQSELANAGKVTNSAKEEPGCILDYIYHCNAQTPSGESGFKTLSFPIGWAIHPMLKRVNELENEVPVTFVYGGRSWMDSQSGVTASYLRGNEAYTDLRIIDGAGHHVYAQGNIEFNDFVNSIGHRVDNNDPFLPGTEPPGPMVIHRHDSIDKNARAEQKERNARRPGRVQEKDEQVMSGSQGEEDNVMIEGASSPSSES